MVVVHGSSQTEEHFDFLDVLISCGNFFNDGQRFADIPLVQVVEAFPNNDGGFCESQWFCRHRVNA